MRLAILVLFPYALFGMLLWSSLQGDVVQMSYGPGGKFIWAAFLTGEIVAIVLAALWPVILPLMLWDRTWEK